MGGVFEFQSKAHVPFVTLCGGTNIPNFGKRIKNQDTGSGAM
jgi:hypothetical protein